MQNQASWVKYLNYIILGTFILGAVTVVVELSFSKRATANFSVGNFDFEEEALITLQVDNKDSSYFQFEFEYPKSEVLKIPNWKEIFGQAAHKNGVKIYPGKVTKVIVNGMRNSKPIEPFTIETTGAFYCKGGVICRNSDFFFLYGGDYSFELVIQNDVQEKFKINYQLNLVRTQKVDSQVSALLKARDTNLGVLYLITLFLPILIFIRLCIAGIKLLNHFIDKLRMKK